MLPVFLVLLPAILLFRLIREHQVNIPFLDDWMFVQMDQKAARGFEFTLAKHPDHLTIYDFFIVQMEHRMAFVRAVIMLFHNLAPGNYTGQMWLTWTMLLGTAVNVFLLLRHSTGAKFAVFWPVMGLAAIAIFSPIQFQIVLWAMMFQVAAPAFLLSTTMVALLAPWPLGVRFAIGLACAVCATLSFATGILVWLLPLPLMLLPGLFPRTRDQWIYVSLWLVAFAVTMGLYFHDLKNETDPQFSYKQQGDQETLHRDLKSFFSNPTSAMLFVFRLLGSHLARGTDVAVMDASLFIGGLSFFLWAGAWVYWWRRFSDPDLRRQLLVWLVFGSYSVGAAALIAMGRLWATRSGENAISARYVIHAVPLTVALVVLLWLIMHDVKRRHPFAQKRAMQTAVGFAVALLMLQCVSWAHGCRMMAVWGSSRLRGAANTQFYNTIFHLEGDIAANRTYARRANELGLLRPPMLKNTRLDNFTISPQPLNVNTAQFSELTVEEVYESEESDVKKPVMVARGYASLPARARVADAVIFTRIDPSDGHWEIFHVAQVAGLPLYLIETMSRDMQFIHLPGSHLAREGVGGFEARFDPAQHLPPGEHVVSAWALDYRQQLVHPMSGYFSVETTRARVKKLGSDLKSAKLQKYLDSAKHKPSAETQAPPP
jgi:hypothetical protein